MVPTFGAGSSLQGGAGGSAGPATGRAESIFDSSGWNVIFGDGNRLESQRAEAGTIGQYVPLLLLALAGIVAFKALK